MDAFGQRQARNGVRDHDAPGIVHRIRTHTTQSESSLGVSQLVAVCLGRGLEYIVRSEGGAPQI